MQEAAKEEDTIRKAMEKARAEAAHANAQDRAKFEAQLAELNQKLTEAEAKNQRALSMAQQTRSGHVYIISNIGSFGEDVLKIGMTRRLEPDDRIKELGDASVPFGFDVHAMIRSDDAPALERLLHERFDDLRVNKVNYRKEFFRVPIQRLRAFVAEKSLEATFTMTAEAREYRETVAYEKMTPEEREKYQVRETGLDGGERLLLPNDSHAVRPEGFVGRHDGEVVHRRLGEDDAVEGVFVMGGQFAAAQQGFGGQGQFDESPFPNLLCPPMTGRGRQRQFAGSVLEGDFPKARVANVQDGFRVVDGGGRGMAQACGFARQPDQGAGIQKQIHSRPSSFMPASSSAAKEAAFHFTRAEVVSPTWGRRVARWAGIGMIFATAVVPSRRRISSPAFTWRMSWGKWLSA